MSRLMRLAEVGPELARLTGTAPHYNELWHAAAQGQFPVERSKGHRIFVRRRRAA